MTAWAEAGDEASALECAPTNAPPANEDNPAITAGTTTQRGMAFSQPPAPDGNGRGPGR
jgi:hypothetical protein